MCTEARPRRAVQTINPTDREARSMPDIGLSLEMIDGSNAHDLYVHALLRCAAVRGVRL